MQSITCIIPTLWLSSELQTSCDQLYNNELINEVIIINNNQGYCNVNFFNYGTPTQNEIIKYNDIFFNVKTFGKFKIYTPPENIFVSAAWNLGVAVASSKIICILNDDIILHNNTIEFLSSFITDDVGIVGLHPLCFINEQNTNEIIPIDIRHNTFGCAMFMLKEKYQYIPNQIKIWYNDDYLFNKVNGTHYSIIGARIIGRVSNTVKNPKLRFDIKKITDNDRIEYNKIINNI